MTRSIFFVFLISIFWNSIAFAQNAHVAVVVPGSFRTALEPWLEYRSKQGYGIHLIEPNEKTTVEEIRTTLQELSQKYPLCALLLVGDAPVSDLERKRTPKKIGTTAKIRSETVPIPLVPAKVVGEFGPHQWIASDNVYADLDGDEQPDIAVGRFSVKTPEELTAIVRKTIRFEKHKPRILASRRINLVAGVGGFSPLIDRTIESSARYILSRTIPAEYEITLTQADIKSPYCPPPNRFRAETIARLNEGPLFWIYLGHGTTQSLDFLHLPKNSLPANYPASNSQRLPIFAPGDAQFVSCQGGLPIAVFLACLTGELDAEHDCLAEELHRLENGPVAVFASSRTSMPYGMSVLGIELIDEIFNRCNESVLLGNAILNAKRRLEAGGMRHETGASAPLTNIKSVEDGKPKRPEIDDSTNSLESPTIPLRPPASRLPPHERPLREIVDSLAKTLDPTGDRLDQQRLDHVHLFHLFGDPLLRLPTPLRIELDAPKTAKPDSTITISGRISGASGLPSHLLVELSVPKSRPTATAPKERAFRWTQESVDEFNALYRKSNTNVVFRTVIDLAEHSPNEFELEIRIPKLQRTEKGEYDLCVYMESETEFALGSRTIVIK